MKLFKCIGFAVLITVFIANIFTVCALMVECIEFRTVQELQNYSQETGEEIPALTEIGENMENYFEDINNDNIIRPYPVLGITLYDLEYYFISEIIGIILGSILVGIILGTIVYLITEKKYTGVKLLLHLILSLLIISLITFILIFTYNYYISQLVNQEINGNHILQSINYSIIIFIAIFFFICSLFLYLFNYIYQKIITKKLNKELSKKQ